MAGFQPRREKPAVLSGARLGVSPVARAGRRRARRPARPDPQGRSQRRGAPRPPVQAPPRAASPPPVAQAPRQSASGPALRGDLHQHQPGQLRRRGKLPRRFLRRSDSRNPPPGLTPLVFGDVLGGKETFVRCGAHRAFPIVAPEHFADGGRLWSALRSALSRRLAGYPLSGDLELDGLDLSRRLRADVARNLRDSRYINDLLFHAGALGLFERVPVEVFYLPYENMARDRIRIGNSNPNSRRHTTP